MAIEDVALRFLDENDNAQDLCISESDTGEGFRLHIKESSVTGVAEATSATLIPDASVNLFNFTSTGKTRIWGFQGFGDYEAKFELFVNGSLVGLEYLIPFFNQAPVLRLPRPVLVQDGQLIRLQVTNCGLENSSYTAILHFDK